MVAYQMFFNTGERIFPDTARACSAQLLDQFQPGLVGALMHYTDNAESKRVPKDGFVPVRFSGAKDGFSLVGFGEQGRMIVDDVAGPLARAWSERLGRAVTLRSRAVECGIEWRPYPMRYTIPRLVVQKKSRHLESLRNEETGKAHIESLIKRSIVTQAEYLGIKVPSDLTVRFIGNANTFGAKLGHGGAVLAGLGGVEFEANACLKGLWGLGFIQSKGYGLLNADAARGGL